nr:DUF4410 domain-containing protein [Desulfobulbaceae bacterium]
MNLNRNTCNNILAITCILFMFSACVSGTSQPPVSEREEPSTPVSTGVSGVEKIELASIETISVEAPLKAKYDNIVIDDFKSTDQIQSDYPHAVIDCKSRIIGQLKSKNAYKNVTDDPGKTLTGKSVIVNLSVSDIRIAGGAARFWGGAFAGNSYMDVLVEIQDVATKEVVYKKILSTSNNAWGAAWTGGSTDHSLPADLGVLIGEYIYKTVPANN